MKKVAINGFGRIGRCILRAWLARRQELDFEIVAINDLADLNINVHLLKYDSNYGPLCEDVEVENDKIIVGDHPIICLKQAAPESINWRSLSVDVVLECTGAFTKRNLAAKHLEGGAKKVIVSAPCDEADETIVFGVNHSDYNPDSHHIISCASCTTNCLAPIVYVLDKVFGVERGLMTTVHAYTNDQRILDLVHKDLRRARAAGMSIIPTTTGAARTVGKVLKHLKGKIDGFALRVPVPVVSVVDFVATLSTAAATKEQVNNALRDYSETQLKGILAVTTEELVSTDFKGRTESSIVDLNLTQVIDNNFVKVVAWYDNEYGFSNRMLDLTELVCKTA